MALERDEPVGESVAGFVSRSSEVRMQGGHRTQMGQREAIDRARSGVASGRDPPRDSASGLDVLQPVICGPVTVDISEHGQVVESERDVRADPCSAYERGLVGVPVAVIPGGLAVA